ncbi:TetR/AcrR family transcriptional regulator [Micromonospora polyrhachis]|uniref:AcrR family transcriptional regulator n=1 Tax=Micromonospora polyrhachis TaxID=1282883 RepID=A0A7W7SNA2_9ACTN|nr:TetR/AcrR family transcriptional regulator [Micromonospora polyrhachis]MBB4957910.1 AcrR family transcriptional regulator [Micromonospora polyrhachis]
MAPATPHTSAPAPRRRGRPTVLDPEAVGATALQLWAERGYTATSWDDLAEATGVSVRTLMRHFPSKAALAWVGVPAATRRLTEAFASLPLDVPLPDALRTAVAAAVSDDPLVRSNGGRWMRLVSTEPELATASALAYQPWTDTLAREIARRRPGAPETIYQAVATVYREAAHSALRDWARDGARDSPAHAVDTVLRWLEIHITAPEDTQ